MLSLANLASYCEGRSIGPRCDFTALGGTEARGSTDIDAPAAEVFASLIEPAQLNRWIAAQARVEPEIGGRYDFGWDHGPVKILELEPDRVLAVKGEGEVGGGTPGTTARARRPRRSAGSWRGRRDGPT